MSKRKKNRSKSGSELFTFGVLIGMMIKFIAEIIARIILFIVDVILFTRSGYKKKSGIGYFKTILNKGYYGEYLLYRKLIKVFPKDNVFVNLYLDNERTEKTEIDLLVVATEGVYVFEMKNYSGYIYGSKHDEYWTQVLNKRTKNKFYNPLRQNYAHTKAVEKYLGIDNELIVPMIIFSTRSKLSKINVGDNDLIYKRENVIKELKRIRQNRESKLNENEIIDYSSKLILASNVSEEAKLKHIEEVKKIVKEKDKQ